MNRNGHVSISVSAGPLELSTVPPSDEGSQLVRMGRDLYLHITPDAARQWVGVLETIASKAAK